MNKNPNENIQAKMVLDDLLEIANNSDVNLKISRLYGDSDIDRVFVYFHQELDSLLGFMGEKIGANGHYNADQSRELIQLISDLEKLKLLDSAGVAIKMSEQYHDYLDRCAAFLKPSNGSPIPENLEALELEKYTPIFTITGDFTNPIISRNSNDSAVLSGGVSQATRRDIESSFSFDSHRWSGRLSGEIELVERLSFAPYFLYEEDYFQEKRLKDRLESLLIGLSSNQYLQFLCETIHPDVRPVMDHVDQILGIYNNHLKLDGYQIAPSGQAAAGRPIFSYAKTSVESHLSPETLGKIERLKINSKVDECWLKISRRDYSGAIRDSHVLLEACVREVYRKKAGKDLVLTNNEKSQGFNAKIKKLTEVLEDKPDQPFNRVAKQIAGMVTPLLEIRNEYGDVHDTDSELEAKNQAELVVNGTIALVNYFYGFID